MATDRLGWARGGAGDAAGGGYIAARCLPLVLGERRQVRIGGETTDAIVHKIKMIGDRRGGLFMRYHALGERKIRG